MQLITSKIWFTAEVHINHTGGKNWSPHAMMASTWNISYRFSKSRGKLVTTKTQITQININESWRSFAWKRNKIYYSYCFWLIFRCSLVPYYVACKVTSLNASQPFFNKIFYHKLSKDCIELRFVPFSKATSPCMSAKTNSISHDCVFITN